MSPLLDRLTERDLVDRAVARQRIRAARTFEGELARALLIAACVCIVGYPLLVLAFCLGRNWIAR